MKTDKLAHYIELKRIPNRCECLCVRGILENTEIIVHAPLVHAKVGRKRKICETTENASMQSFRVPATTEIPTNTT